MAGPEISRHLLRDRAASHDAERSTTEQTTTVHEKLTNSVQEHGEKQTSSQSIRVASLAVTRTGTYAGARAFGILMDEHESQPASDDAEESLAWLDFLEECRQVLAF